MDCGLHLGAKLMALDWVPQAYHGAKEVIYIVEYRGLYVATVIRVCNVGTLCLRVSNRPSVSELDAGSLLHHLPISSIQ